MCVISRKCIRRGPLGPILEQQVRNQAEACCGVAYLIGLRLLSTAPPRCLLIIAFEAFGRMTCGGIGRQRPQSMTRRSAFFAHRAGVRSQAFQRKLN